MMGGIVGKSAAGSLYEQILVLCCLLSHWDAPVWVITSPTSWQIWIPPIHQTFLTEHR